MRAEVLQVRERGHVDAAFLIGASRLRIAVRHILPLSTASTLIQFSVTAGFGILLTAGLSFVGAGVRPPTPEWGLMIASGAQYIITGAWWASVFPGLFLGIAVFALALIGEGVRRSQRRG
jgi:peptide/nickel transport system permease protein